MKRLPKTPVKELIEVFLSTCNSRRTAIQYREVLYEFSDWLRKRRCTAADQLPILGPDDILEFLDELRRQNAPSSKRRTALIAIRSWFAHLGRQGYISDNPASRIKNPITPKHLYRPLTEERVLSAFDSINDKNSKWPARDRAIFETIYEVALTTDEVCAMNVENILWDVPAISIQGKKIPMEETLVKALRDYVPERNDMLVRFNTDPESTPALFVTLKKRNVERRLGPHRVGKILKGIDPQINPCKLRDAGGIHMLNHGATPRIVAALFRVGIHAIKRLQELSSAKPRERLRNSHPRATIPQSDSTTVQ